MIQQGYGAQKLAKILRADRHVIAQLEERMLAVTGRKGVLDKIVSENEELIKDKLLVLGVPRGASAKEVYDALISKIESDDNRLFNALGSPACQRREDCQNVAVAAKKIANPPKGFFLKLDKAEEFLTNEPPENILKILGYGSVREMLAKEDIYEVMSALRFVEGSEWLNAVFFKQYEKLTPADFEEREIQVRALQEKWGKASEQFVIKKKHNISHLKELGVVFVIPVMLGISGEILRMFVLILHYLNEIPFYSDIFRDVARDKKTFMKNFISLLRGDVREKHPPEDHKISWLVVQRYLAKEDENDWRLFTPHINPEALHWDRAGEQLAKTGKELNNFGDELAFWNNIGWLGDYFKDESGVEVLVSFDLVDTVMSLVKEKEMVKYLYHHQEALWNKIFAEYLGREKLEAYSRKYLLQGYFEV